MGRAPLAVRGYVRAGSRAEAADLLAELASGGAAGLGGPDPLGEAWLAGDPVVREGAAGGSRCRRTRSPVRATARTASFRSRRSRRARRARRAVSSRSRAAVPPTWSGTSAR
ncbi:hypothetical protein ACFQ2K_43255 [Streptomyces sanglieri]|uniref:Uncharacterized protein n=1 Tax=Streptomyces sanglieri TaxID=193460 RepID=A0ABW2X6E9_9ACTN